MALFLLGVYVLEIQALLLQRVKEHAVRDAPVEACGLLAGVRGIPHRFVEMKNAMQSDSFYGFDPEEQREAWNIMDILGEDPIVIYHSHSTTPARPSRTDIRYAWDPDVHYLIYSVSDDEFRSWLIRDGQATNERIVVVP